MKALTKGFNQFNKHEALTNMRKEVSEYTEAYMKEITDALIDYVGRKDTIWIQGWLARKGIDTPIVNQLRERYADFDRALRLADKILEERYIAIPFHKHTLSKHCSFLLERSVAGRWLAHQQAQVGIHVGDIFTQLDAKPIIEVKELGSGETVVARDKEKLYLMEPESKSPPGQQLEMDVSVYKEELVPTSDNFFPENLPIPGLGYKEISLNSDLEKISGMEKVGPAVIPLSNNLLNKSGVDVKEDIAEFMKRVRAGDADDKRGNANKRKKGNAKKQKRKK